MKTIVGLRHYGFQDQRTGEYIEGYTLHLQWSDDDTEGVCCEKISIQMKKLEGYEPKLGDVVRIGNNQYGKPDFVVKVG